MIECWACRGPSRTPFIGDLFVFLRGLSHRHAGASFGFFQGALPDVQVCHLVLRGLSLYDDS